MKEYFSLSLIKVWLLISIFSLGLPIFMPSSANPQYFFENVIGAATVIMFILSFPSSFFGLPVLFFAGLVMNINLNSIEGLYLNLVILFALGLVQWFWIVPRLLQTESPFQMLNLRGGNAEIKFSEAKAINDAQPFDLQGRTPLERVFQEKDCE
jgi:hypothetical protein